MKLLVVPVLIAFFAVAQVFCEESDPREEADYWSSNKIQDGWLSNNPFREILLRMTRKPRPNQFIGLMGKRSSANAQITHKNFLHNRTKLEKTEAKARQNLPNFSSETKDSALSNKGHKVNSFVGLMGKRSQEEPESYEWSTLQTYDKRR